MEFLLTRYIYPIPEPMILSERLGFSFDNPRTTDEISEVKDYLVRAYESGYDYRFPIHSDEPIMTLDDMVQRFHTKFSSEDA